MHHEKDESFGVIPVRAVQGDYEVLLINQNGSRGDTFWTLPKGHREEGETVTEAAARELEEETGLSDVIIKSEQTFSMQYQFQHETTTIDKTVYFYLGMIRSGTASVRVPREVAELEWLSFEAAIERATHQEVKRILGEVRATLQAS